MKIIIPIATFMRGYTKENNKRLTLRIISKQTGIDISILSRIRKGTYNFNKRQIEKIAAFFDLPPEKVICIAPPDQS